ncbi:MAG: helix-turn-helix domain-containing protein [Acidimicrobiales bacterium]|nr:helix-turn-helix domain-containing protein [Acidimicrobiales bacterium]MDP6902244.1 helix-turn-helix domain-containing protein [Acidimicrobiales bacterium]HJM00280.1 helix-turn-helix domain-containing protein [Acidimicrobiales bacterium]
MESKPSPDSSRSQTLDRGLKALTLIATSPSPMTIDEVATQLKLGRSVTYRMIRTLEDHRLVTRDPSGRLTGGTQLVALAGGVENEIQTIAAPILTELANSIAMTSFLVVSDGQEAVTVQVVEPTATAAHVAYRPGTRHPLDRGAPGIALLAGLELQPGERREVAKARNSGWAYSEGEVIEGMASIAAPVSTSAGVTKAAVAVVHLALSLDSDAVAPLVVKAANTLGLQLP